MCLNPREVHPIPDNPYDQSSDQGAEYLPPAARQTGSPHDNGRNDLQFDQISGFRISNFRSMGIRAWMPGLIFWNA